MKVSVRLIGGAFPRAEALVADLRRRALERLQARIAARHQRAVSPEISNATDNPPRTR